MRFYISDVPGLQVKSSLECIIIISLHSENIFWTRLQENNVEQIIYREITQCALT